MAKIIDNIKDISEQQKGIILEIVFNSKYEDLTVSELRKLINLDLIQKDLPIILV